MKYFKLFHKAMNNDIKNLASSKNSLFRELSYTEKQAVEVYDFRNMINPGELNSNVLITCEHASNKQHKFDLFKEQKEYFDTHWGYDIGAKNMGLEIAESAQILSVFSNFSRLIIDPNRSLLSDTLIRKYVEKDIELEMNKEGKII